MNVFNNNNNNKFNIPRFDLINQTTKEKRLVPKSNRINNDTNNIINNIEARLSPIIARGFQIFENEIELDKDKFSYNFEIEDEFHIRLKLERYEGWTSTLSLILHLDEKNLKIDVEPRSKSCQLIIESPSSLYKAGLDKQLIPRIIHQTFVSKKVPNRMYETIQKWNKINPEYQYKYYSNRECRTMIQDNFHEDVLEVYDTLLPGAYKADLWRYCVLYLYGGIYVDIAMVPSVPLRDIIDYNVEFISARDSPTNKSYLYNAFMASKPKHPALLQAIKYTIKNVNKRLYGNFYDTLIITGPTVLGKAINKYIGHQPHDMYQLGLYKLPKSKKYIFITEHLNQTIYKNNKAIISTKYPGYPEDRKLIAGPHYWQLYQNKQVYCEKIVSLKATKELTDSQDIKLKIKIPNYIYQTFQTNYISNNLFEVINSWSINNPEYHYKFINHDQHLGFLKENFGELLYKAYLKIDDPHHFLRIDLWKYCYLYQYGGIFTNISDKCYSPLKNIIKQDIDLVLVINKNNPRQILKNFIASIAKNPIILKEISRIVKDLEALDRGGIKDISIDLGSTVFEFMSLPENSVLTEGVYDVKPFKILILSYDPASQSIFYNNNVISRSLTNWESEKLLYNF